MREVECCCARGGARGHGPYLYLRWQRWDAAARRAVYHREYVPASEVARVRRWIRPYRSATVQSRGILTRLRHLLARKVEAAVADNETPREALDSRPYRGEAVDVR
jgi:hypothetical protein